MNRVVGGCVHGISPTAMMGAAAEPSAVTRSAPRKAKLPRGSEKPRALNHEVVVVVVGGLGDKEKSGPRRSLATQFPLSSHIGFSRHTGMPV